MEDAQCPSTDCGNINRVRTRIEVRGCRRIFGLTQIGSTADHLGIAEQVFLGGLDNLTRMSDALKSLGAIDHEHIERRLHALDNDGIESSAQDREKAALAERAGLRDMQRGLVDRLLAENEAAMTRIDQVMAAIGGLDTSAGHASMGMEAAMDELRVLAERAGAYAPALPDPQPTARERPLQAASARGNKR